MPVFFLPNINSVFTIAKVSLLHFLVSLLVGIWLFYYFTVVPRPSAKALLKDPLRLMTVVLAAIYFLSTLISVHPSMSFWGSYMRREGIYTVFSFMVYSLILAQTLRNRALGHKIILLLLIGSGLASIYGIYQHFRLDPLFKDPELLKRIMSTAGNPLFFSIYLAMLVPFVVSLFIITWGKASINKGKRYLICGLLVLLLLSYSIAFWFSQSRGPLLGLAAGLLTYLALYSLWKKKTSLLVVSGALFLIMMGIVVLLALPNPLLGRETGLPVIGKTRILSGAQMETASAQSRFVMWNSTIAELLVKHPSIGFEPDKWNILRPLLGYGPEGMDYAFARVFPPELVPLVGRGVLVDRAHNRYIDIAAAAGFLGVTALLTLIALLFIHAWRWLKNSRVRGNQFIALAVMSTMVVWMVDGIFGINTVETALFFWSLVAVASASSYWEAPLSKRSPRLMITQNWGGVVIAMIALFVLLWSGIGFNLLTLRADYNMRQGIEFSRSNKPDKALAAFSRAVSIQPRWSIYSNYLARTYFRIAEAVPNPPEKKFLLESAAKALNKARNAEPLAYNNYTLSAFIYTYWSEKLDKSRWDEAFKFYETASRLAPGIPSILNDWAISLGKAGRHAEAVEKLDKSLSLESDYFQTHILRAVSLFNLQKTEPALREVVMAIKLNASVINQFSEWSNQLKNMGRTDGLLVPLKKYVEENPEDWIGRQLLAIVYIDSEKYQEGVDEMNRSLSLVPEARLKEVQPVVLNILNKKVPPDKLQQKK